MIPPGVLTNSRFNAIPTRFLIGLCCLSFAISCTQANNSSESDETIAPVSVPPSVPVGWQTIATDQVSLSLPPDYQGGNPGMQLNEITAMLEKINPDYRTRAQVLSQNAAGIAIVAFQIASNPLYLTNVSVTPYEAGSEETLAQYQAEIEQQLAQAYDVSVQESVTVNEQPAIPLLLKSKAADSQIQQLLYLVQGQEMFWAIAYATTSDQFAQQRPLFEQSIQTFRFIKK